MRLTDLFKKRAAPPPGPLTGQGLLASDLWIDQPDAHERIERMRKKGEISSEEAERLARIVDQGYLSFPLGLPHRIFDEIEETVDRIWREKPADLAWASKGPLRSFAEADEARDRKPSYRIADFHSHCAAALDLYLDPQVFRYVELILGQPAIATQSLYFEYGSQQPLHRDPVFVQTQPPSHLFAAWIALEDVGPRCGPLVYVPGSHRLPYYQFEPGEWRLDNVRLSGRETEAMLEMAEFDRRQVEAHDLEPEVFTCKRGDALIWHASLLHGGAVVEDPSQTRKSFVVHFSTRANYKTRLQRIVETVSTEDGGRVERTRILETGQVFTRDGRQGFDNPLRDPLQGYQPT
ncbi:MAG TPA: phytanoyl-CoA dioxygenase family protein [Thermoanaerobaculia bacterium]|nr:phytanoyl-CoA dioxygenase family protein [Thermoanaerobaculia bacterium]